MRTLIYLALISIIAVACNKNEGFLIKGNFENAAGKTLYLDELTTSGLEPNDSTKIESDGSFEFKGIISEPKFYVIRLSMNNFITVLVDSLSNITLSGNADNLASSYNVEGSADSKLLMDLDKTLLKNMVKIDSLSKIFHANKDNPAIDSIKALLDIEYSNIYLKNREFNIELIKNNPNSLAILKALYQRLGNQPLINQNEDFNILNMVDSAIGLSYPNSKHYKALHANVVEIKKMKESEELNKKNVGIGAEAPEISLPDPNGKIHNLSDFKGKYVLLDFWAAWCRPCRMENPNLVENYKKYNKKGFEIFQVSLDKSKQDWLGAISADKLTWTHVSDLEYWNSPVAKMYNIQSIPANLLLDKNGIIIAKDLRGEELGKKLSEVLK